MNPTWTSFKDKEPPKDAALDDRSIKTTRRVLVTNNIEARDRMGRMSHVWFESPIKDRTTGEWVAFDARLCEIFGLTHWLDPIGDMKGGTE